MDINVFPLLCIFYNVYISIPSSSVIEKHHRRYYGYNKTVVTVDN